MKASLGRPSERPQALVTACQEGCGACCDPVVLPYNRMEAILNEQIPVEDRRWAERCLTAMPVKEAWAKLPWLANKMLRDQFGAFVRPFYFRCSNFDPDTRACTDYENRPDMCRNYPWYNGEPRPDAALPPTCSYNADLGRAVVPVALSRKPEQ